jgi:outer membrane receptor protein involved in Fe transport
MLNLNSARALVLSNASWLALTAALTPAQAQEQAPSQASAAPIEREAGAPAQSQEQLSDAATSGIGDIVVTAQRREESLQQVPIAITAFSQDSLVRQRIDSGPELVRGVPNVNFSKGYFAGFNFQIRGVGTQLGTAGGDAGVAVHLNNVPLSVSRFFEAEFFDVERVEVLRGPQGTLYGRNATGGVVNVVTARPIGEFSAMASAEVASYDSFKTTGMLNLPLAGDRLALRVAGSYLKRDGFGINTFTGNRVNGRDLWSTRATLSAQPVDGMDVSLMWQHFKEDDDRSRTGGSICVKDNGPATVGGVAVTNPIIRGYLSQGCADASIYSANSNQAPNSLATLFGFITQNFGPLTSGDYFANKTVSRNLQDTDSVLDPRYKARNDLVVLNLSMQITPSLNVTTISSYMKDKLRSAREFQGAVPDITFNTTALTPGGFFNDPQLGSFNRLATEDYLTQDSRQITQEVRVDSSFGGRFNFSVGGIYVNYKTKLQDYVQSNAFTYFAQFLNTFVFAQPSCAVTSASCIYIEPNDVPQNLGHNYFVSTSPFELDSMAVFGEAYWDITDQLKLTIGGRFTHDSKRQLVLPVRLLTPGSGQQPGPVPVVSIDNKEPTGRVAIDWKPDLAFTDQTLIYGVASRGYKAGGLNPPASFNLLPPYRPEFVNAVEFGTKNTLFNGRMSFNLTAFHYEYKDYQVTEIRNRTQEIQNIDAKVKGIELESTFEPIRDLRLNLAVGYLDTNITKGAFVDPTNFTNKSPDLTLVRGGNASTCAVSTAGLAAYLATNPTPQAFVNSVCAGLVPGLTPNLNGVTTDLRGNHLPNAPKWTVSVGAQYTARFGEDWQATLRGDYYWQDKSFARTYNTVGDRLRSYDNVNATLTIENESAGWQGQFFVKNLFNTQPVTNTFVLDQIIGVARIGFVTDPRVYGVSLTKRFGR